MILSTIDRALSFDGAAWQLTDKGGPSVKIARSASNHLIFQDSDPVIYTENDFKRILSLRKLGAADYEKFANLLHNLLKLI